MAQPVPSVFGNLARSSRGIAHSDEAQVNTNELLAATLGSNSYWQGYDIGI